MSPVKVIQAARKQNGNVGLQTTESEILLSYVQPAIEGNLLRQFSLTCFANDVLTLL